MKTFLGIALFCLPFLCGATVYTVDNSGDSPVAGTLRTALNNSNSSLGKDTIFFNFIGPGPFTITLFSSLPDITESVVIDGYSQPSTTFASGLTPANISIIINGGSFDAIRINADDCFIRGLVLNKCNNAIAILGTSSGNKISGNHIGVAYDGISWNFSTHANSTGIALVGGTNNIIGGLTDAERNVITGNTFGLLIGGQGLNNKVIGNFIGVNAICALSNVIYNATGIIFSGSTTPITIGGTTPGSTNVISGNYNAGVLINTSDSVTLIGNYIGTDHTGLQSRPNAISNLAGAVQIFSGNHNVIGGTNAGEGNIISGNVTGYGGIYITGTSDDNKILGNKIGVAKDGTSPLGNSYGIYLDAGNTSNFVTNTKIGNTSGTGENTIAYNSSEGIYIYRSTTTKNTIVRNRIFCNGGAGINLSNSGNGFKQAPIITKGSIFSIVGTSNPGDTVELFYADTTICASGQGINHLAFVVSDNTGFWRYNAATPLWSTVLSTATNVAGNTSKFSNTFLVSPCSTPIQSAGPDLSMCASSIKQMAATSSSNLNEINYWLPAPEISIQSSISNPNASITSSSIGTYVMKWVTEDTMTKCSLVDSALISTNSLSILSAGADIDTCVGTQVNMNASTLAANINLTYVWTFPSSVNLAPTSDPNATVSINSPGTYWLKWNVTDTLYNCFVKDSLSIHVIDCNKPTFQEIIVYNAVSPNEDNINDFFMIENIEQYPENKLVIYDRDGNEIYFAESYSNNWKGTNKAGAYIATGTYYYKLIYLNQFKEEKETKGYIEVKR